MERERAGRAMHELEWESHHATTCTYIAHTTSWTHDLAIESACSMLGMTVWTPADSEALEISTV